MASAYPFYKVHLKFIDELYKKDNLEFRGELIERIYKEEDSLLSFYGVHL